MLCNEFKNATIECRKTLFRNTYTLWVDSLHISHGATLTQDGEKVCYHHYMFNVVFLDLALTSYE